MWTHAIVVGVTTAVIGAVQAVAMRARPGTRDGAEVYAASPAIRLLLHACPVLFFAWGMLSVFYSSRWDALIPFGFMVMSLLGQPNDIALDSSEITSSAWLRRPTRISWGDVTKIIYRKGSGATYIYGRDGSKIVHSYLHADSAGEIGPSLVETGGSRHAARYAT